MSERPAGWRTIRLDEFVKLKRGFDLPSHKRVVGKYKVLSSGKTSGTHNEGPIKGPGFVIGRATNLGRPTWSDEDFWPLNTTLFVEDFLGNDPRFAFHVFEDLDLSSYNSGSVQPMLNRNYIANVMLTIPRLDEQRRIATALRCLDGKISSNNRIITLIPQLIRALVSDALGHSAQDVKVADLATFVNGGAYTKGASGTGRMVIRIAELNSGPGASTVYSDVQVPENKTAFPGDLLMSWSGSLNVYRWFREEAIVNQHIFKVLPNRYPAWLVYDRLDAVMPIFQRIAKDKATTMGHIQRGHLESTAIALPPESSIDHLNQHLESLWNRLLVLERENVKLGALRDVLLPELLAGRIRVSERVEMLEEVPA
jgi:type I restriction enzyme S subunit